MKDMKSVVKTINKGIVVNSIDWMDLNKDERKFVFEGTWQRKMDMNWLQAEDAGEFFSLLQEEIKKHATSKAVELIHHLPKQIQDVRSVWVRDVALELLSKHQLHTDVHIHTEATAVRAYIEFSFSFTKKDMKALKERLKEIEHGMTV